MWIVYLTADKTPLAWAAFIILLPVALLGFAMFARWIGVTAAAAGGRAGYTAAGTTTATVTPEVIPAEGHLSSASDCGRRGVGRLDVKVVVAS